MANFVEHVTQTLSMTDGVNPRYTHINNQGSVLDILEMFQVALGILVKSPLNQTVEVTIFVSSLFTGTSSKAANSEVAVTQTVAYNIETGRSITQTLTFQQFVIARLDKSYHYIPPHVPPVLPPAGPASPTAPPVGANTVNIDSPVFTLTKGDDILELRLPKFGDHDKYEQTRIKRNTRGGTLIIYRDPMWPEQEILSYEFEWLSATQVADLLTFMHTHLGEKITITDQFDRDFDGFIITPESEVAQPKRIGYSAKFDFQIFQEPPV